MWTPPPTVSFELGQLTQRYNTARVPGKGGTTFSLRDLIGSRPSTSAPRLTLHYTLNANHQLRVLLAPLSVAGTGSLPSTVTFRNTTFAAGAARGDYQFNSYRVSYLTALRSTERAALRVGGTLKIRDARIALTQGGLHTSEYNLGVVPLLYAEGSYSLAPRWEAQFDLDAAGASQGRAIDFGLRLGYQLRPDQRLTLGWRTLEGGANIDRVYNFARLDYLMLGVQHRF